MNYLYFQKSAAFIGILCLVVGCTNDDDSEVKIDYKVVDNLVSSWEVIHESPLEREPISELLCIGESSQCPIECTYASIENYDSYYPIILYESPLVSPDYGYRMPDFLPESNEHVKEILKSDYYGTCPVKFPGRGTYDFAVKIHNPDNERYYITRPHRLKVWEDQGKWHHSISLIEEY
ncbi:hypothetical protein [Bacteroides sp.]